MKRENKNSVRGKKSRASGARFELKVRKDLESKDWIVDKWTNTVDLDKRVLTMAKRKFNPFSKVLGIGTGFPDFICIKREKSLYNVIGVEVKANGWLDKTEKEKCGFLLDREIFSKILIAKKGETRGKIKYVDFKEKYGN